MHDGKCFLFLKATVICNSWFFSLLSVTSQLINLMCITFCIDYHKGTFAKKGKMRRGNSNYAALVVNKFTTTKDNQRQPKTTSYPGFLFLKVVKSQHLLYHADVQLSSSLQVRPEQYSWWMMITSFLKKHNNNDAMLTFDCSGYVFDGADFRSVHPSYRMLATYSYFILDSKTDLFVFPSSDIPLASNLNSMFLFSVGLKFCGLDYVTFDHAVPITWGNVYFHNVIRWLCQWMVTLRVHDHQYIELWN